MSLGQSRWIYCDARGCDAEWYDQRGSDSYPDIRRAARKGGWIHAPGHATHGGDFCPEHAGQVAR